MWIRFCCPNGHPLRVPQSQAGRRAKCPKCQAVMEITLPSRPEVKQPLTDTGVMRILETDGQVKFVPDSGETTVEPGRRRVCPRCQANLSVNMRVCDHCHLYLGMPSAVWDNALSQIRDAAG